jgi:hypothetical protein
MSSAGSPVPASRSRRAGRSAAWALSSTAAIALLLAGVDRERPRHAQHDVDVQRLAAVAQVYAEQLRRFVSPTRNVEAWTSAGAQLC